MCSLRRRLFGSMLAALAIAGLALTRPTVAIATESVIATAATAATPVVYISVPSANAVDVFAQGGDLKKPIRIITDQLLYPAGLWVDQHQNLWVVNGGARDASYLLIFAPGSSKAAKRIAVPKAFGVATQIWVATDGTVYSVDCIPGGSTCAVDRRSVAGTWSHVVTPNIQYEYGLVGDNQGDLYATGSSGLQNGNIVEALFKGAKHWQLIGFPFTTGAGGLAFDFLGRLTIADSSVGDVFSYQVSILQLQDAFRCYNCNWIAFDASGTNLWALTAAEPSTINAFAFPGGAPTKSVQLAMAAGGMAVSPAYQPPPPSALIRAAAGGSLRR